MKKIFTGHVAVCGMLLMTLGVGLIVKQVIDERTIALVSGAFVGILIAAPCAVIVTLIAVGSRQQAPQQRQWPGGYDMTHIQMLFELERRLMEMGIDPHYVVFKPEPGTQLTTTRQPGTEFWRQ